MRIRLAVDGVTAADYANDRLLIGTKDGSLASYRLSCSSGLGAESQLDAAQTTVHKPKKKRRIIQMVPLLHSGRIIVVYSSNSTAGFDIGTLSPVSGFAMRDVELITRDTITPHTSPTGPESLVICTKNAIRVIDTYPAEIKLLQTIDYIGIKNACGTGTLLLVATSEAYELVDIVNQTKIPLFPVAPNLTGLLALVSESEYLVVQGTEKHEPSMGLVISKEGEVTRQGQVISWDRYPESVTSTGDYILAVVGNELVVHDIRDDFEEVQRIRLDFEVISHVSVRSETVLHPIVDVASRNDSPVALAQQSLVEEPQSPEQDDYHGIPASSKSLDFEASDSRPDEGTELAKTTSTSSGPGECKENTTEFSHSSTPEPSVHSDNSKWEPEANLLKTGAAISLLHPKLFDRFGDSPASRVDSNVLILTTDRSLDWWLPPPPFLKLEKLILSDEISEITPDLVELGTERGVVELEYASLLLGVHLLDIGNYIDAMTAWLDGIALDPQFVLYVFGHSELPTQPVFPGLRPMFDKLREKPKSKGDTQFLKSFLRSQLKRQRNSNPILVLELEHIYSRLLTDRELVNFISSEQTLSYPALIDNLKADQRFDLLEQVLNMRNDITQLIALWKSFISGTTKGSHPPNVYAQYLADQLIKMEDKEFVWSNALELISLYPLEGVKIFTDASRVVRFDESLVYETLRQQDGGAAWRAYLNYLVYDINQPHFVGDLATLLLNDLIGHLAVDTTRNTLEAIYKDFADLDWPKRSFYEFLHSRIGAESSQFQEFEQKEIELARLILEPSTDVGSLVTILTDNAPRLLMERSLVYSRMGLHVQSLELLIRDLRDYSSVFHYCVHGVPRGPDGGVSEHQTLDADTQQDIVKEAYRQLVAENSRNSQRVIGDLLLKAGSRINLPFIMENSPSGWPLSLFQTSIVARLNSCRTQVSEAVRMRSLAIAKSRNLANVVKEINAAVHDASSMNGNHEGN